MARVRVNAILLGGKVKLCQGLTIAQIPLLLRVIRLLSVQLFLAWLTFDFEPYNVVVECRFLFVAN